MEEKIQALRSFLPPFLVENRALYGILSKGIHELTEDECGGFFPVVRTGIELILDEQIERESREAKIKKATQDIARAKGELGKDKG